MTTPVRVTRSRTSCYLPSHPTFQWRACAPAPAPGLERPTMQHAHLPLFIMSESNQHRRVDAPALRLARINDASVGAYTRERAESQPITRYFYVALTSGHSTVSAFIFITYNQLENASLNVLSDALSACSPSTFARSVSASSASSATAGPRNPRPCGASGCAPERESAKREPCETRRSGVRSGVGPGMVVIGLCWSPNVLR
jgi:hypothetical protein